MRLLNLKFVKICMLLIIFVVLPFILWPLLINEMAHGNGYIIAITVIICCVVCGIWFYKTPKGFFPMLILCVLITTVLGSIFLNVLAAFDPAGQGIISVLSICFFVYTLSIVPSLIVSIVLSVINKRRGYC